MEARRRKIQQFICAGAAATIVFVGCHLAWIASQEPSTTEIASKPTPGHQYGATAAILVKDFLAAGSWFEKLDFVRDPSRVAPLMSDYYERPENSDAGGSMRYSRMTYSLPQIHPHGLVSEVTYEIDGIRQRPIAVEYTADGPKIEWESHVVYSTIGWDSFRDELTHDDGSFRVAAAPSDRLVGRFNDRSRYLCFRLTIPGDLGEPVYGYALRNSSEGRALEHAFVSTRSGSPLPFILELSSVSEHHFFKQVEIREVIQKGWRTNTESPDSSEQYPTLAVTP